MVTEQMILDDGAPAGRLHHIAFAADSRADIIRAEAERARGQAWG